MKNEYTPEDKDKYDSLEAFSADFEFDFSHSATLLGSGSYGKVYLATKRNVIPNEQVAIKVGNDLESEFTKAYSLSHKNLARYSEFYQVPDRFAGTKDYLIMPYYPDGNLNEYLRENVITEEERRQIVTGILQGLKYLHGTQKRIHRDLKSSNILIYKIKDKAGRLVETVPLITDFGLVKVIKDKDYVEGSDVELSDGRGTLAYKAPEQVEGERAHFNLDLWAFGVILYEICLGEKPFTTGTDGGTGVLLRRIKNVEIPEKIHTIAEPYQTLIKKCLVKDIKKRVRKAEELLADLSSVPLNEEEKTDYKADERTDLKKSSQPRPQIKEPVTVSSGSWPEYAAWVFSVILSVILGSWAGEVSEQRGIAPMLAGQILVFFLTLLAIRWSGGKVQSVTSISAYYFFFTGIMACISDIKNDMAELSNGSYDRQVLFNDLLEDHYGQYIIHLFTYWLIPFVCTLIISWIIRFVQSPANKNRT